MLETYTLDRRAERPLYSTIVEGELRGLAQHWGWGTAKVDRLNEILAELVRVSAGEPEVIQAYAELYFEDRRLGHNTGDNDLWIAATAKAVNAALSTFDDDCEWMSPALVRVVRVPHSH